MLNDYLVVCRAPPQRQQRIGGNGLIGVEPAPAFCRQPFRVTVVCRGRGIRGRLVPPDLSRRLTEHCRPDGVRVRADEPVGGIALSRAQFDVETVQGSRPEIDVVASDSA